MIGTHDGEVCTDNLPVRIVRGESVKSGVRCNRVGEDTEDEEGKRTVIRVGSID